MSSTLARQLRKVAGVERGETLVPKAASFLFDPQTAAKMGAREILEIGQTGLSELKLTDPRFGQFSASLFASSAEDFEMESLTKEELDKKIKVLDEFLRLLSPYFLLRPAHKAIEFLIRKYQIHTNCVDSVMKCILPYHSTPFFSRMVQILKIAGSRWFFLSPVQKTGQTVERRQLVNRCINDLSILEFICQMVKSAVSTGFSYKTLTSFYCALVVETVAILPPPEDKQTQGFLRTVLPVILAGVKDQRDEDFQVSSYLLLSQICARLALAPTVITGFVDAVCAGINGERGLSNALSCLLLMAQAGRIQEFSRKAVTALANFQGLVPALASLSERFESEALLRLFVSSWTDAWMSGEVADEEGSSLLRSALKDIPQTSAAVPAVAARLISARIKVDEEQEPERTERLNQALQIIASAHPEDLDKGIQTAISKSSQEQQGPLLQILGRCFAGTRHAPVTSSKKKKQGDAALASGTTLFLALRHPEPSVRKLAIQASIEAAENMDQGVLDSLRELFDREEDCNVIVAILSHPSLSSFTPEAEALGSRLSSILRIAHSRGHYECAELAVSLLAKLVAPSCPSVALPTLLGEALIPVDIKEEALAVPVAAHQSLSSIAKSHPLLKGISKLNPNQDASAHNLALVTLLANNAVKSSDSCFPILRQCTPVLSLLAAAVAAEKPGSGSNGTVAFILSLVRVHSELLAESLANTLEAPSTMERVESCVSKISVRARAEDKAMLLQTACIVALHAAANVEEKTEKQTAEIFELLLLSARTLPTVVPALRALLPSENPFVFLSSFWERPPGPTVANVVRARSLIVANTLIASQQTSIDVSSALPSLLAALADDCKDVRQNAIAALLNLRTRFQALIKNPSASKGQVSPKAASAFLRRVVADKDAFVSSPSHLASLFEATFGASTANDAVLEHLVRWSTTAHAFPAFALLHALHNVRSPLKLQASHSRLVELLSAARQEGRLLPSECSLLDLLIGTYTPECHPLGPDHLATFLETLAWTHSISAAATHSTAKSVGQADESDMDEESEDEDEEADKILLPPTVMEQALSLIIHSNVQEEQKQQDTREHIPCIAALQCLTPEFVQGLGKKAEAKAVSILCSLARGPTEIAKKAHGVLRSVPIAASSFSGLLKPFVTLDGAVPEQSVLDRAGEVLESLQLGLSHEQVSSPQTLIKSLFAVLRCCVAVPVDSAGAAEADYASVLCLSILRSLLDIEGASEAYDSSLLISIIQSTEGRTQVRHEALLLLGKLSASRPQDALDHAIPLFVAIGSEMQVDNPYIFAIAIQVLEAVVPAVAQDLGTSTIISEFFKGVQRMPSHRRVPVLASLVRSLPQESEQPEEEDDEDEEEGTSKLSPLAQVCMALLSGFVPASKNFTATACAETAHSLLHQFDAVEQVGALLELLNLGARVFGSDSEEPSDDMQTEVAEPYQAILPESPEWPTIVVGLLQSTSKHLASLPFLESALEVEGDDSGEQPLQRAYLQILEKVLLLCRVGDEAVTAQGYGLLERLNGLLSVTSFVAAVSELLEHNDLQMRRKALELLNSKIENERARFTEQHAQLFVEMLPRIRDLLKREEATVNKQTALYTLEILARNFARTHRGPFADLLPHLMHTLDDPTPLVFAGGVLCIAAIASELEIGALAQLNSFFPKMLGLVNKQLDASAENPQANATVLHSLISAVNIVVTKLHQFLSPFLETIVSLAIHPVLADPSSPFELGPLIDSILQTLATKVEARLIFARIDFSRVYEATKQRGADSLCRMIGFVGDVMAALDKQALTVHYPTAFRFFRTAFAHRSVSQDEPASAVDQVEDTVIKSFLRFVLRLNENMFKPMFLDVVHWATADATSKLGKRKSESQSLFDDATLCRCIFLFKLVKELLNNLKGIFVSYMTPLCDTIIEFLNAREEDQEDEDEPPRKKGVEGSIEPGLLGTVQLTALASLEAACKWDVDQVFLTPPRFERIMEPLVEMLQVPYTDQAVVSCIQQFSARANDEALLKTLHHQLMMKSRSDSSDVRARALRAVAGLFEACGSSATNLVAEATQFLFEALEDDTEEVVDAARSVCQTILDATGEDVSKHMY